MTRDVDYPALTAHVRADPHATPRALRRIAVRGARGNREGKEAAQEPERHDHYRR